MTWPRTALVMVGPSGVGPFHSPDLRIGMTVQLIECGSNGPYWLKTPDDSDPAVQVL